MALELARAIADRLSRDRLEVENIQLEMMRADLMPRDCAEQLTLLLLTVLFGATPATAAATAESVRGLVDADGVDALRFVAGMIRALATLREDGPFPPSLAYRSTIAAELGDGPAVRIRFSCDDGSEEIAFTNDPHGYRPDRDISVGVALLLSGRTLFYVARDFADLEGRI